MVEIAIDGQSLALVSGGNSLLLQRVCDQREHLLVLVQKQHRSQIPEPLVCESRRRQEFQAFYLTKVRSFAEGKEV